ncbi:MAG: hypothetical protein KatS3mg111_2497 [Pirellulaceae bacterium]|nr:MAG: hypothetical protein KatS3mg111_2497 [Pirellulaceae bacterium]
MYQTPKISRRTILRGMGVSLALPWLESTTPAVRAAGAQQPPVRMGFIFVPNGVNVHQWFPRKVGYGFDMPYVLEPLKQFREDLLVFTGLTHDKGRANGDGPGDHARAASVFLTGAQPRKTDGDNIRVGVSVDQVAAKAVGHLTRFSSLELGIHPGQNAGNCDSGYSCAYSSNISWASETTPMGKEVNPRLVFERLFAGGKPSEVEKSRWQRLELKKSVLDFVQESARRLEPRLSYHDRRKVDEYLSGIREIERRMDLATAPETRDIEVDYPVPDGIPKDYREHIRLMCDMAVLAFQTDSTRIFTLMFANAGDNKNYRHIGVSDGHHDLSHHRDDPVKLEKIAKINRFHVEQFRYLLERLKSVQEGDGTLLDHSMIVYGSGIHDGNRHNNENLPVVLAGRGGGTIDSGRHVRYDTETPMCNLFLSMLERMDVHVPYIGDSTGKLPGLTV